MKVFVEGVGLLGPGLNGWAESRAILAGSAPYQEATVAVPPAELLPPAERRRTALPVRLALAVGHEAVMQSQRAVAELPSVFASSSGDGENIHHICETLATSARDLSPTRFHNSVHNAPAGYWSIATRSLAPSTALCCGDATFAASLLETAAQVMKGTDAAVLICCDAPFPEPLHAACPLGPAFGVALVVAASRTKHSLATLEIDLGVGRDHATPCAATALEALRRSVPTARVLPLLAALANPGAAGLCIDYIAGNQLAIEVQPC